jgi:hypothetical protein
VGKRGRERRWAGAGLVWARVRSWAVERRKKVCHWTEKEREKSRRV